MNKSPLSELSSTLSDEMQSVDYLINQRMFSKHAPLIQELTNHLINAGGKRLRPLLTLACANICNYKGTYHIHLAAIVELIHTATLLHDDVIDESFSEEEDQLQTSYGIINHRYSSAIFFLLGHFS